MKKKKLIIIMSFLFIVCIGVGSTIAYYNTSDTFTNSFNTGKYEVETQEVFESPDDWAPGTTTPKTIKVTNKGNVTVAVRAVFIETWEDEDGNPLPYNDSQNHPSAIINYSNNYTSKWVQQFVNYMRDNNTRLNQFYYSEALAPGESTIDLIDSVTFNPDFNIVPDKDCVTDNVTHETTCTTEYSGYAGGKYKLMININTIQYDLYPTVWDINSYNIYEPGIDYTRMLKKNTNQNVLFGKEINRQNIESVQFLNNKNVPNDVIDSWDASHLDDGSVMAWIKDEDNNNIYELYIGAEGGVRANQFSNNAFNGMKKLKTMDLTYLDTSDVVSMYFMFANSGTTDSEYPEFIGLENLNTSKVVSMDSVFTATSSAGHTYDFSNWDISNVTNMRYIFTYTDFTRIGTDNWPIN